MGRRGSVLHASLASLARNHIEEAITTLASIMKDKRAPAMARIKAAAELLNRGYGRSPQSIEVLTPSSEISEFATQEEINAELRRRGLASVLDLDAEDAEKGDRGSRVSGPKKH